MEARVDGLCEAAMATVLTTEASWIVQSDDATSRLMVCMKQLTTLEFTMVSSGALNA